MQGEIIANGTIVAGMIGQRGAPGKGISSITKTGESGLVDTYTITYTNGDTTTFNVTNGAKGDTGVGVSSIEKTGTSGLIDTYTITYTDGDTDTFEVTNGEKGDTGSTPQLSIGSVTKGADASATITGSTDEPVLNLVLPKGDKGDTGNTGATPSLSIGSVSTGTPTSVTISGTTDNPVLNFVLQKGDSGSTGNGISSIYKTGTSGNVDTYTILYTNSDTDTFDVTNANVVTTYSTSALNTYSCTYLNSLVGDINDALDAINNEVI